MSKVDSQEKRELKKEWMKLFSDEGETEIRNAIENKELEEIAEQEFINELKHASNSEKTISYIETFEDEVKEALGIKHDTDYFQLDKYKDLNKTRLAQEMADFAIHQLNIIPVDVDRKGEQTDVYQYNHNTGAWEYYPENHLGRLCKDLSQKEYSQHLEREFTRNIINHGEFRRKNDMGLPDHELLLSNKEILKLETGPDYETREVEEDDFALYHVNAEYDPDATCPRFQDLVVNLLDGDEKQVKTLQEYMGWLLKFPNRDYKKALLILGVTNSGKSQLADIITHFFSDPAVNSLSLNQMGLDRRFHVDKLNDGVVNVDRDMGRGIIEGMDTVKQIISQEQLNVEPKGQDSFVIDPDSKHIFCSNVAPNPDNEADGAFYERFLTLKTPNTVPKEDRVPDLGRKIFMEERNGILNWMLEGLRRLEKQGHFTKQSSPYETKAEWNQYGDSVQRFVWECIEKGDPDEDYFPAQDLHEEYKIWMQDRLMQTVKYQTFVRKLTNQPFISKDRRLYDGGKVACFEGIEVDTDSGNLST